MSNRWFAIVVLIMAGAGGCQQIGEKLQPMGELGQKFVDVITQRPRVAALKMEDQYFPDERRQGINQLVDRNFGKSPPYTDRYEQIAQTDPDYLVRATAIRALNRSRHRESTPAIVKALDDPAELVRLEAAKALVNMPDPNGAGALRRIMTNANENKDVRIAAAEALKHYRDLEGARALIAQLGGRDFGIAWQARKSLINITGKDMRYDEAAWLNYVTTSKPFG